MSIIVNSRNIFCLGWKSDKSLATQNKNDDLSDNDDNVRDNDNNFIVQKNIKRDIVNNNSNNIFQQLLRAKQHIARSRSILSDNINNIDDNDNNYSFIQKYASLQK